MGQLSNQIRVLLQRMRLSGREPHKILMHQGLKEALQNELNGQIRYPIKLQVNPVCDDEPYDPRQGMIEMTFEGLPIVVDNSLTEILIQAKPKPHSSHEPFKETDWKKIIKTERL